MEIGEVKMKLPWEGQEIIVSGIVLSVLCGLSHSISPENPETWTIMTILQVRKSRQEMLTRYSAFYDADDCYMAEPSFKWRHLVRDRALSHLGGTSHKTVLNWQSHDLLKDV